MRLWVAVVTAAFLVLVPGAGAQGEPEAPLVLRTEEPLPLSVDPYHDGSVKFEATLHAIGYCTDEDLVPPAQTFVSFRSSATPPKVEGYVSPPLVRVNLDPGDCPADGAVFDVETEAWFRSHRSAALLAGREYAVQVAADMQKQGAAGPTATYGPYYHNITFVVGYAPGVFIRLGEDPPGRGRPGETVSVPFVVQNGGNAEVDVTVAAQAEVHSEGRDPAIVDVTSPAPVVIAPFESRTVNVTFVLPDEPDGSLVIRAFAEASPTDERYWGTVDSETGHAMYIQPAFGTTPGVGVLWSIAVLAGAAIVARRPRP